MADLEAPLAATEGIVDRGRGSAWRAAGGTDSRDDDVALLEAIDDFRGNAIGDANLDADRLGRGGLVAAGQAVKGAGRDGGLAGRGNDAAFDHEFAHLVALLGGGRSIAEIE